MEHKTVCHVLWSMYTGGKPYYTELSWNRGFKRGGSQSLIVGKLFMLEQIK